MAQLAVLALALAATVGEGRDPFASYGDNEPPAACQERAGVVCGALDDLRLKAVVTGTATPRAMFEDKAGKSFTVRVGDEVAGMRVKALLRDRVLLSRSVRTWEHRIVTSEVVVALRN